MYCVKCGAQLPPDSQFCTVCGAKMENASVPDTEPNVGPIAPPPMDQPIVYGQPPKKKSKALLWTLIGVGAALIVAAVLFFVVFAPASGIGPFSGNTTQTRFANDVAGVFTGALSGFETKSDMDKMLDEPFELEMNSSVEMSGIITDTDVAYAYDELALGISTISAADYSNSDLAEFFGDESAMESTMKLLLLEDTLYIDQDGSVSGIRFDTDADLSKPMSLKDRITALFESNKTSSIDYMKLTEMFLNSIDESCFDKSADETTLTLDADALADTLSTFSDKLEDDDQLNDAITDMIEEMSGYPLELSSAISMAAPMMKQLDFEMTFTVSYENGAPSGLEIEFEDSGSMVFNAVFSYENEKDGKAMTLDVSSPDGQVLSLEFNISKTKDGADFDGSVTVPGSDVITFSGTEVVEDSKASVNIEMSMGDQKIVMNSDQTIKIGKPAEAVEDDSRFEIDTSNANIIDLNDIFSGDLTGITDMPSLAG